MDTSHLPTKATCRWRQFALFAIVLVLNGCQSVGFGGIDRDRGGYSEAIAESWKEQMLLNIVKIRYLDVPVYLDIQSVVSSYTMEQEGGASAALFLHPAAGLSDSNSIGFTGRRKFSESPTISYVPLTGERFANSVLRPLPPETVFAFVTAGGRMDFLLRASVQSVNGIANASSSPSKVRKVDPRFLSAIEAVGRISEAGALGLRIEKSGERSQSWLFFRRDGQDGVDEDIATLKKLLGLNPALDEFRLVYGVTQRKPDTIAVMTRSMQGIVGELSVGVDVPEEDLRETRATRRGDASDDDLLMRISSSRERPANAFAAARYRDHWFWIDDRDLTSKRTFRFLLMFSSMSESGTLPQGPLLTIPTR